MTKQKVWRIKMKLSYVMISIIAVVCAVLLSSAAFAQELKGKHKENAIACVDCHKVENPDKPASMESCIECHGSYADVKELTKDLPEANPHDSHLGELDCRDCHKMHKPSEVVCASCHNFDLVAP